MSGSKMLKCILTRSTSSHVCVRIENQSSGVHNKSGMFNKNDEYKNVKWICMQGVWKHIIVTWFSHNCQSFWLK